MYFGHQKVDPMSSSNCFFSFESPCIQMGWVSEVFAALITTHTRKNWNKSITFVQFIDFFYCCSNENENRKSKCACLVFAGARRLIYSCGEGRVWAPPKLRHHFHCQIELNWFLHTQKFLFSQNNFANFFNSLAWPNQFVLCARVTL